MGYDGMLPIILASFGHAVYTIRREYDVNHKWLSRFIIITNFISSMLLGFSGYYLAGHGLENIELGLNSDHLPTWLGVAGALASYSGYNRLVRLIDNRFEAIVDWIARRFTDGKE